MNVYEKLLAVMNARPRLRKIGESLWECRHHCAIGYGHTPTRAYEVWRDLACTPRMSEWWRTPPPIVPFNGDRRTRYQQPGTVL